MTSSGVEWTSNATPGPVIAETCISFLLYDPLNALLADNFMWLIVPCRRTNRILFDLCCVLVCMGGRSLGCAAACRPENGVMCYSSQWNEAAKRLLQNDHVLFLMKCGSRSSKTLFTTYFSETCGHVSVLDQISPANSSGNVVDGFTFRTFSLSVLT